MRSAYSCWPKRIDSGTILDPERRGLPAAGRRAESVTMRIGHGRDPSSDGRVSTARTGRADLALPARHVGGPSVVGVRVRGPPGAAVGRRRGPGVRPLPPGGRLGRHLRRA